MTVQSGDVDVEVTAAQASVVIDRSGGASVGGVTDHGDLTGLADDDHPHYLTPARGDARYDATGSAAASMAAHVTDPDPHPAYLTPAEGDARYAPVDSAGGGVTVHGELTGLDSDDHGLYAPVVVSVTEPANARAGTLWVKPATAPVVPTDRPIWEGNAETGDLSQFAKADWNFQNTPAAVVTNPARGNYAVRCPIKAGDLRCEIEPPSPINAFREGDDLWFHLETYLQGVDLATSQWQVVGCQWKNSGTGSPPLHFQIHSGVWRMGGGYGHPGGPNETWADIGPAANGTWDEWTCHVVFSADPAKGEVSVWRNGTLAVDRFHPAAGTLYPGLSSYWKLGYYRSQAIGTDGAVVVDNMRWGLTRASVEG